MKLAIGLTGGISCGKSTTAEMFAELGIDIIDADEISREMVEKGSQVLQAIAQHFGASVLLPDGALNRYALRDIIFNDPDAKNFLEKLLHPLIRDRMRQMLALSNSPYTVLVVPLLMETTENMMFVKRILVVDAPPHLQLTRTQARDACTPTLAEQMIGSQIPREQRLERADDVITNEGDLIALQQQVKDLHKKYLHLAHLSAK